MDSPSQTIIIPQPRSLVGVKTEPFSLVPLFDLLRDSRPATRVANFKDDAQNFSKPIAFKEGDIAMHVVIKAPGTDFYIPPKLAQFVRPVEEMISYQYGEANQKSINQTGQEYCNVSVYQKPHKRLHDREIGAYNQHIDMNLADVVAAGCVVEYIDRYVASDRSGTHFCDFPLDVDPEDVKARASSEPDYIGQFIRATGRPLRQAQNFDLMHFDNARGHALDNPAEDSDRTLLVMSFSRKPIDPAHFNNPMLSEVYLQRNPAPQPLTNQSPFVS